MNTRTATYASSPAKRRVSAPLLALATALMLVAVALASSSSGLLPLTLALLGAGAAFGVLRQAVIAEPMDQSNTVTV